jgi:AcrR family transcriptional regulator
MARPRKQRINPIAQSLRQLRRFCHLINADKVFGTHRLGVRQASLYYYFSSKEAALATICELGVKDFIGKLRSIIDGPMAAADKLRAAIANHLSPLRSHPEADYIRVFLRHRHELPDGSRQSIAALARTYQRLIEQLFLEALRTGN